MSDPMDSAESRVGDVTADGTEQGGEVVDLFAGPGGWDVAARVLGIDPLGIELDDTACATRAAAGLRTLRADVATTVIDETAEIRGLIASPPCQTFSSAGEGAGRKALDDVLLGVNLVARGLPICEFDDPRTALVVQPLRYALLHEPEWLAWEQVPPVLPVWEACAHVLRAEGYSVWTGKMSAEEYGVPQTRKRAVLIASRSRRVGCPAPTHRHYRKKVGQQEGDPTLSPWLSMAEALGWGWKAAPCWTVMTARNRQSGHDVLRGSSWRAEQIGRLIRSDEWLFAGAGPAAERTAGQLPRRHDEPAHAVTGAATAQWVQPDSTPANRREGSIRVTVQEAGILQSFPADYPWQGTKTKQYQQVGNAIPPLMALHILAEATGLTAGSAEVAA